MKLKGLHFADVAEIQQAVTDELKKVQKEEFLATFQKLYDSAEACIYASGAYFELKKKYLSLIFKRISPKTFGPHCVVGPQYVMEVTDGLRYMDMLQQFVITQTDGNLNTIFFPCWVVLLLILATTLHTVEFLIETCPQSPAQWRWCGSEDLYIVASYRFFCVALCQVLIVYNEIMTA